jgi:predicted RecB family nuclease
VQLIGRRLVFSPSDLSAYLACPHLTALALRVTRGELEKPFRANVHADLIRRKGEEHEAAYLAQLRAEGRDVVEIGFDHDWEAAARATQEAVLAGAEVVYQPCLADGGWRGFADFLERQPDGGYEAVDTKLARRARPEHILQLCFYTRELARLQGHVPRAMHVVNGLGERESFRPDDFLAYYDRVRRRFLHAVEGDGATYPYPVDHCGLCDFLSLCKQRWEDDDHLVLVAGISRSQVERLAAADVATLTRLGEAARETRIRKLNPVTFEKLRHQAELQLHRRRTGEHRVDLLPPEPDRGLALLPKPSPGDIWLDLEGDPWFEPARGLEYLFGYVYLDGGEPRYECIWARDDAEEKAAFEQLIDLVSERRRRFPDMHVYHYAPYERTALQRLMGQHGTRESELDDLLRGEVLVDLYRVTRQALRASVDSYSIKRVEELYEFERSADVSGGSESVAAFEHWLEIGDDALLEDVRAYNEEDCRSLYELHQWLLAKRPSGLEWRLPPEQREPSEESAAKLAERERVRRQLLDGAEEGEPRWLLAQLLDYHRREEKPQWWEYFHHRGLDAEELFEDTDTIGGLELRSREQDGQSFVYTFTFPAQEHKIGRDAVDPRTEKGYTVRVDDEQGTVQLRRSVKRADEPLPEALVPPQPLYTGVQRDALLRFTQSPDEHSALVEILERRPPRANLDGTLTEAALSLDGSYLFVQGPPGSGKTWNGARAAIALMQAGRRVGITALSHRAINKFLDDVEQAAVAAGFTFSGRKKCSGEETRYESVAGLIDNTESNDDMRDPELQLVAGTSFLFAREDQEVDTLFIDEGGQLALADALAVGTAARNVILLGDPNQLPQVTQGTHPPGAGASVLSHLLGEDGTVRPGMGLFLEHTWRMRPEVNEFISTTFYESRLRPAEVCLGRSLADGNGLRFVPIEHEGNRTHSPEEADFVRDEIARLLGTPYVVDDGERTLREEDLIVVAPYNAQVRCLRQAIPEQRVRIGTVDKFQGQQAAVVFYSLASSSGDDVPRGLDFLFSRHRLNVAVSRAKCLAYLVASPRLLDAQCKTIEQMRLANALCRFVEAAR